MPRISNTVSPEAFEAMRERAELARNDPGDGYDPPVLPTFPDLVEIEGGFPQPKWPDDVILPDNKDMMEQERPVDTAPVPIPPPLPDHLPRPVETPPEPEAGDTSQADRLDGELVAQNPLIEKGAQALSKMEALLDESREGSGTEWNATLSEAAAAAAAARDGAHGIGGIVSHLKDAMEGLRHDTAEQEAVLETQADDVHEAETVPETTPETNDTDAGGSIRDVFHTLHQVGGRLMDAIEASRHDDASQDAVVETQTDDVYEAEAAPIEADEDSDPYDSEP